MKKTVLTLIDFYAPGFKAGGTTRSVENLVAQLGTEIEFRIVSRDRDLGDLMPYPGIVAGRWARVGNAEVLYIKPGWRGLFRLVKLLSSLNRDTVLYLNSYFSRRFSMLPVLMTWLRLCQPFRTVLAPRGEFSHAALQLRKERKRLYIRLAGLLGFYREVIWQASTVLEEVDIERAMPNTPLARIGMTPTRDPVTHLGTSTGAIAIAKDLHIGSETSALKKPHKRPGKLDAVFISRIAPMKNLLFALEILESVRGEVSFDIYGPVEDADYWSRCNKLIGELPPNVRVTYRGVLNHGEVQKAFSEHDLFLFPTLGENFGHVICEAMSAGCPVLISDRTPWRNLEQDGAGWDVPLANTERFSAILQHCVDTDDERHGALVAGAIAYANRSTSDPLVLEDNRNMFRYAAGTP